jgi:hypothetical protein
MADLLKIREQNKLIIQEINSMLRKIAYDGRGYIKVRLRRKNNSSNLYEIEVVTNSQHDLSIISLGHNPFNCLWVGFTITQIKKGTLLNHCKKSRFGGYTFY